LYLSKYGNLEMERQKYMIKRIIIWAAAILTCFSLAADELDDKMQQLRQIEREIDLIQQKAKQTEQKKKKTQSDITYSQRLRTEAEYNVRKLLEKENVMEDSLMAVVERVNMTEDRLENLKQMTNNEFLRLFYIDMQDRYLSRESKDKYLLSLLISSTARSINNLTDYHWDLLQTEEDRRQEYLQIRRKRVTEFKKSEQYKKKIQTLTKQATKLESEKQKYEQQASKLKKDAAELETLVAKLAAQSPRAQNTYQFSGRKIPWPVHGRILRDFGEESRGNNTSVINNGIDIAVPEGTSVIAVDDGEVVFSDRYGGQGKLIIIDHKNGFFSVYAYNSALLVSRGASVVKGQTIAKSGSTGSAIQPSLHFELRKDGRAVNPLNYLE